MGVYQQISEEMVNALPLKHNAEQAVSRMSVTKSQRDMEMYI